MKLKQIFNFREPKLSKEDEKNFAVIDCYIDRAFDITEKQVTENLRKVNLEDKDRDKKSKYARYAHLDAYDLQFHTRDTDWLVSYVRHIVNFFIVLRKKIELEPLENSGIRSFSTETISRYVTLSPKFDKLRNDFEQKMTKAYINIHKNENQDFLCDMSELNKERKSIGYDILFREHIVEAMTTLGVTEKSVNVALESNRELWLPAVRQQSFENAKENNVTEKERELLTGDSVSNLSLLDYVENQLFTSWNALRDYRYYQTHKDIIDELNLITPNMKINTKKQNELMQEVHALGQLFKQRTRTCHMLADIAKTQNGAINDQGYIIANNEYETNHDFTLGK